VALGEVNVDKMLRSITAKQLAWWEAYASLEPLDGGTTKIIQQLALVAQVLANVNRGEGQSAYKLDDFILKYEESGEEKPKQTDADKIHIFKVLEAAFSKSA
jgi:hypothetical protein